MAVVELAELKAQLNVTHSDYDTLIQRKLDAALNHIERLIGFKIETAISEGTEGFEDGAPEALREAICQLAAHWYENREAASDGRLDAIPFGVEAIVNEYRDWTF